MKTKKRSRTTAWSGADHALRDEARQRKKTDAQSLRRAVLTHETKEKRDGIKLKLHITKTQRELSELRSRLTAWDQVEEDKREEERLRKERERNEEPPAKKKRRGRGGPEKWTLKGAARPAWQVYDFDTRYVDPHLKAHEEAKEKAKRSRNLLVVLKGKFGTEAPPAGREYLGLLMQLGHLSQEARQFKTAREALLECIELEGDEPITTARESLMRMYLDLGRSDAALRLGERLVNDSSPWIRYSLALVSHQLEKETTEDYMIRAIQSNPFCAYYLAYYETFQSVMEYTEELEDTDEEPQSSFEEALEYCSSEQSSSWAKSGAAAVLRGLLERARMGNHDRLVSADIEWKERLAEIEKESEEKTSKESSDSEDPASPDISMFASMFRTAMEMVSSR